jgi:sugar phosphate isomerase/epimerase
VGMIGLSSGCFTGFEGLLESSDVSVIELSSHSLAALSQIIAQIEKTRIKVASVHCPCPSRGPTVNLASVGTEWERASRAIHECAAMAAHFDAKFIIVHAFYCLAQELPVNDLERMAALRLQFTDGGTMSDYLASELYGQSQRRAITNLKQLLPDLMRAFPKQRLVLENLNPRLGYGGVRFGDVVAVAKEFGGDVGICLDVGHLALALPTTGEDMESEIDATASDLIWTSHIHQNFGGRFALDRYWNEAAAHSPELQEFDTHLPFLTPFRRLDQPSLPRLTAENSAFAGRFEGCAIFCPRGTSSEADLCAPSEILHKSAAVEKLLSKIPRSANRILELDSRFAPLSDILSEYSAARSGVHPSIL